MTNKVLGQRVRIIRDIKGYGSIKDLEGYATLRRSIRGNLYDINLIDHDPNILQFVPREYFEVCEPYEKNTLINKIGIHLYDSYFFKTGEKCIIKEVDRHGYMCVCKLDSKKETIYRISKNKINITDTLP